MTRDKNKTRYIGFRVDRPTDINSKCAQCASTCKQHKNLVIVTCPFFISSKRNVQHPVVGVPMRKRPLEAIKSITLPLTQAEQGASLKGNITIVQLPETNK